MNYNDKDVTVLRENAEARDEFIGKHSGFVLSCASKALGKFISKSDDEYSVALIAFDEAITKYDISKGSFKSFAATVIKSRLIDDIRRNDTTAIPMSALSGKDSDGNERDFDTLGEKDVKSDTALELEAYKQELSKLGLSLFDIPQSSPKSYKTKSEVARVLMFVKESAEAKKTIIGKGEIPANLIREKTGVKAKILERHRKYIIAATIALCGEYPIISGYIKNIGEVKQ